MGEDLFPHVLHTPFRLWWVAENRATPFANRRLKMIRKSAQTFERCPKNF